jgi:hypothetical protein
VGRNTRSATEQIPVRKWRACGMIVPFVRLALTDNLIAKGPSSFRDLRLHSSYRRLPWKPSRILSCAQCRPCVSQGTKERRFA